MLKAIKYLYRYGFIAFILRLFSPNYCPRRMGMMQLLWNGVRQVGTLWTFPTRKSLRVWYWLKKIKNIEIILTFPWGGGASAYLESILSLHEADNVCLIVQPINQAGRLHVSLYRGNEKIETFYIPSLTALYPLQKKCCQLTINHLLLWHVYYIKGGFCLENYARVIEKVIILKKVLKTKMIFLVHDYLCVCPNYTLMFLGKHYCNSEYSMQKCEECLTTNKQGGIPFAPEINIQAWRQIWSKMLYACDEVRTFSQDSLNRIKTIYPQALLTLKPHQALTLNSTPIIFQKEKLVIGVIGNIYFAKGSEYVVKLADLIQVKHKSAEIIVIGSLTSPPGTHISKHLKITGEYQHDELMKLIARNKVNLVFFSSICPETFSYVVQEVMDFKLPIVCYDIGAPVERIRHYEKGMIIPEMTIESTWETIQTLASKMEIKIDA